MAAIRNIKIENFRCIKYLDWFPRKGVNCLIAPGDSGKSAILDAIELCLSPRRSASLSDADFYQMTTDTCISVTLTLGALDDTLLDVEQYGLYLRGFNPSTGSIEDEPAEHIETVLSLQVTIGLDLEPRWKLVSDRAFEAGSEKDLPYAARTRLAPTRLGPIAMQHLSWGPRSILNRFSTATIADAAAALAAAARQARASFGSEAKASLEGTLATVATVSERIGVDLGTGPQALLDAHGVSFTGGAIALHNQDGVPLRNLGLGSARLLVAALQLEASQSGAIAIIDEIEYGLEPHRIVRLLHTVGAKQPASQAQVFITTHSPVVVRELAAEQIAVVRRSTGSDGAHTIRSLLGDVTEQKVLRACAEGFLAKAVVVCEGETEVGLLRGLDLYRQGTGRTSLAARGVTFVLGQGDSTFPRAISFAELGYPTAILGDDDKDPTPELKVKAERLGIEVINWGSKLATEDCLFRALPDEGVAELLAAAAKLHTDDALRDHIANCSGKTLTLEDCRASSTGTVREVLRAAAKKYRWFKTISAAEVIGETVVGKHLDKSGAELCEALNRVFAWADTAATTYKRD